MAFNVSDVRFNKPVFFDENSQQFRSVGWLGRLVRWIPPIARKQDRRLVKLFMEKIRAANSTQERNVWLDCAKRFERTAAKTLKKEILPFADFILCKILEPLVEGDKKALEQQSEFLQFVRANHLDKKIRNQNHSILMKGGEPHLLFEGEWKSWSEIKRLLSIDSVSSTSCRLADKGYSYLGEAKIGEKVIFRKGLVKYDPAKWEATGAPRPYKQLTAKEIQTLNAQGIQLPYIENIVDCRAEDLPAKALDNDDHCFKKMVDENGWVYYFGLSPKEHKSYLEELNSVLASHIGVIESPDRFADVPPHIRDSYIIQSEPGRPLEEFKSIFKQVFQQILILHSVGVIYNTFDSNCGELMVGVDRRANLPGPSEKDMKVEFYKLFPQPLQAAYLKTPLPTKVKRWTMRLFLDMLGFNKGEIVGDFKVNARAEVSLEQELMVSHPRRVLAYIKAHRTSSMVQQELQPVIAHNHRFTAGPSFSGQQFFFILTCSFFAAVL